MNWWMVWLFVHSFLFHSNVVETSSIWRLKNKSFHCLLVCVLICMKSFEIIVLFYLLFFAVGEIFVGVREDYEDLSESQHSRVRAEFPSSPVCHGFGLYVSQCFMLITV